MSLCLFILVGYGLLPKKPEVSGNNLVNLMKQTSVNLGPKFGKYSVKINIINFFMIINQNAYLLITIIDIYRQ